MNYTECPTSPAKQESHRWKELFSIDLIQMVCVRKVSDKLIYKIYMELFSSGADKTP